MSTVHIASALNAVSVRSVVLIAVSVAFAAGAGALGCAGSGGSTATTDTTTGQCVVSHDSTDAGYLAGAAGGPVFEDAFDCYGGWTSFQLTSTVDAGPHASGPRTEWINKLPPHGATEFPVGTIIVKYIEAIDQTFAMEKRGQGYNSAGANGWEYFDLDQGEDGGAHFVWRGNGPPLGMTYGGDPTACNVCHVGFQSNDYIPSPALQLGNF